jgi:intraflagellar transport protein 122
MGSKAFFLHCKFHFNSNQIANGKTFNQVGSDKDLGFDPCGISYFSSGEFFVMAGSDKKVTLWNKDGVLLGSIGEMKSWIWGVAVKPKEKAVFAADNDGGIAYFNVDFSVIHGLYHDRYAYRELMTDVII